MNKKYIIGIVLVVLSIFAVVFFVGRDNNDATFKNGTEQNRDEAIGVENTENIETGQEQTTIPPTNPSPQIQQRAKDGALIIYYLDKGFTPNNLNAKRGETIRFINNSNNALRLASTEYSETENKSFAYFGQEVLYDIGITKKA